MAKRKTRLLIDGDHIVFAAASAVETVIDWGDDISSVYADKSKATAIVERHVEKLIKEFEPDETLFAVSASGITYRHRLNEDYKSNRKKQGRPIILGWLRRWAVEEMDAVALEEIEADDVVGISATHPKWSKWRQIIVTEDKDLKTIPGEVYIPSTDELIEVTEEEAELHFFSQVLGGDTVDGFPGCPGIGYGGARQLLTDRIGVEPYEHTFKSGPRKGTSETRWKKVQMETYWDAILSHYEKAGQGEAEAILNARMAYILNHKDYDFKERKVTLWEPS